MNDFEKVNAKLQELSARVQFMEEELEKLKKGELGTGVYLEGCPEYAKDFINKEKEGK